jgi:hypothetical protein
VVCFLRSAADVGFTNLIFQAEVAEERFRTRCCRIMIAFSEASDPGRMAGYSSGAGRCAFLQARTATLGNPDPDWLGFERWVRRR